MHGNTLGNTELKDEKIAIKCNICNKTFANSVNLSIHTTNFHMGDKVHEGHKDKTYNCGYCGKSLTGGSYYLNKHVRILHETYKCEYCGDFFPKRKLKMHILN